MPPAPDSDAGAPFDEAPTAPEGAAGSAGDLASDWALRGCATIQFEGESRALWGRYVVLGRLGRGGMGVVYHGKNPRLQAEVAIKVLPPDLAERTAGLTERFVREARLAARVRSDHLVQVLDVDREESSGAYYLVMEYVRGCTARQWCRNVRGAACGAPEGPALDVVIAASRGLAAAHAEGIVHRDVKPDNVLIPFDEAGESEPTRAKLADLGLARAEDGENLTAANVALGTPGYMPPEQAHDMRSVGSPADVFAMGATLYALLAGRPPFVGDTGMAKVLATLQDDRTPLRTLRPDVSAATASVIERCLRPDPADRYADGAQLLSALLACRAALGAAERPAVRRGSRRLWVAGLIAAAALVAGVAAWRGLLPSPPAAASRASLAAFEELAPASGAVLAGEVTAIRGRLRGAQSVSVSGVSARLDAEGRFALRLSLAEGQHALVLRGCDGDGRVVGEAVLALVIDRTAPELALDGEDGAVVATPELIARGRVSDLPGAHLRVALGGQLLELNAGGRFEAVAALAEGLNRLELVATDAAGNARTLARTVYLDTRPPVLELEGPADGIWTSEPRVLIAGRVVDATAVRLFMDGQPVLLDAGRFRVKRTLPADGSVAIVLEAVDGAGHAARATCRVTRDATPPRLSVREPVGVLLTRAAEVRVLGHVEDAHPSHVAVGALRVDVGPGGDFDQIVPAPAADGRHELELLAYDRAGGASEPVRLVLVVDRRAPELTLELPVAGAPGRRELRGDVDEDGCGVVVDGVEATVAGRSFAAAIEVLETREVWVTATDRAGNISRKPLRIAVAREVAVGVVERVNSRWGLVLVQARLLDVAVGTVLAVRREGRAVGQLKVVRVAPIAGGGLSLSTEPVGAAADAFAVGDEVTLVRPDR